MLILIDIDIDFLPDTGFGYPTPKIWPDPDLAGLDFCCICNLYADKRNDNYSISRPFLQAKKSSTVVKNNQLIKHTNV